MIDDTLQYIGNLRYSFDYHPVPKYSFYSKCTSRRYTGCLVDSRESLQYKRINSRIFLNFFLYLVYSFHNKKHNVYLKLNFFVRDKILSCYFWFSNFLNFLHVTCLNQEKKNEEKQLDYKMYFLYVCPNKNIFTALLLRYIVENQQSNFSFVILNLKKTSRAILVLLY